MGQGISYRVSQKNFSTFDEILKDNDALNGRLVEQHFF